MKINGQDHENPIEDMGKKVGGKVKNQAGKAVKAGVNAVKKKIKQEIKKALVKVAKKVLAALGKALMKVLAILAKYILVVLAVLLIIAVGYYILFEVRGAEQNYTLDQAGQNELSLSEGGYYVANTVSGRNKAILDFYTALGTNAYYQITGDDNTVLTKPDGTIRDEYNRESEFSINPNFLFVLDEYLHQGKFKYPEQFLQPVSHDSDTLKLKELVDDEGYVVVDSKKYDPKTGLVGTGTEKSVHDYGLATIFKYKEDEEIYTFEGNITKRDVWDATNKKVVTETLATPVPFNEVMVGYPRKIYLIDKMVSFAQDVTFAYETTKVKKKDLDYGITTDPKQPVVKVKYGEYEEKEEYDCSYTLKDENGEPLLDVDGNEIVIEMTCERVVAIHDLYEYRDGGIYETKPRPADYDNIETMYGSKYLEDYMRNYKAWVPESVMLGFNFLERGTGLLQTDINLGASDGAALRNLWEEKMDILEKYGTQYGVDPYLLLALWMAESSGRVDIEDGPFQITGDGYKSATATNVLTGQKETFAVYTEEDRRDVDKAVHFAAMYLGGKIQTHGDMLKGLQAYNFDVSGYMKEFHPLEWEGTTWMNYREDARAYYAKKEKGWYRSKGNNYSCAPNLDPDPSGTLDLPIYGNACYLEHVLQYYIGDKLTDLESVDSNTPDSGGSGSVVVDFFKSLFGIETQTYEETTPKKLYYYYMNNREVTWAKNSIISFSDKRLFSETYNSDKAEEIAFWQDGFSTRATGLTAEQFILLVPDAEGYIPPLNMSNIENFITSMFGSRTHPVTGQKGKMHNGMDIGIPVGTPLYAVKDGTISIAVGNQGSSKESYGNYVKIDHGNHFSSLYGHMSDVYVKNGDKVTQGQLIGLSGNSGSSTGPHLHFEFWKGTERIDPYNILVRPESYSPLPISN